METFLFAVGTLAPLLLILVVVHELGHFATARAIGVKVLEFGVGFPAPRLRRLHRAHLRCCCTPRPASSGSTAPSPSGPDSR